MTSLGTDMAQNHDMWRCGQEFVQPCLLLSAVASVWIPSPNSAEVSENASRGNDCCGSKGFPCAETDFPRVAEEYGTL